MIVKGGEKVQKIGVNFNFDVQNVEDLNPSFAKARVAIAYAGRNRNMSSISKDVFNAALPSLKNCPLVGRYDAENDDFGSHDIFVIKNQDGKLVIENSTVPFGVIPESSQFSWEFIEDGGEMREYLFCDVLLWKRQYGYDCLSKQDKWHQSMEIAVDDYSVDNDGYCVVNGMNFEALCVLGNNVEPCFESASVQISTNYAMCDYKDQFASMLAELKQFAFDNTVKEEGGKEKLIFTTERRDEILAQYEIELGALSFEITEDMTEEAFTAKLEEMKMSSNEQTETFTATYRQKYEALSNALRSMSNDSVDYWVCDFTDEYVMVERYAFINQNWENDKGRFRYSIDENNEASLDGEFELMILQWLTTDENQKLEQSRNAFELLKEEFETYKENYSTANDDVIVLEEFKASRLDADHKNEVDGVLAEFADLSENDEFTTLSAKAYEFADLETLREKCFAIRGKNVATKFAKQIKPSSVRIPMADTVDVSKPYGDLFDRYQSVN